MTVIATGSITADALEAVNKLKEKGVNAELINASTIKPFDEKTLLNSAAKTKKVVSVEEHQVTGGLGAAVAETLCKAGIGAKLDIIGFENTFCSDYGWHQDLKRMYGMSPDHIFNRCLKACGV